MTWQPEIDELHRREQFARETRPLLCEWVHDAYALLPQQLGRPSHGTRP